MNNIFLIGCPCTGKTTTSNTLAEEYNLNVVHIDDLVKHTFYPLCDILLNINGTTLKETANTEMNNIPNFYKYSLESLDIIDKIDYQLNEENILRDDFIQNFDKMISKDNLPKEISGNLLSKFLDKQKFKELFEINDNLKDVLKRFEFQTLLKTISRNDLIQMLNDDNLNIDNKEVVKYHLNQLFDAYTKSCSSQPININQITDNLSKDTIDLNKLNKVEGIDTTDKFSMLIDCIDIEHSIDRKKDKTSFDKEMHDICFKIKEVLMLEVINNSLQTQSIIDIGGGMTYMEGEGQFQDEYKLLKNSLKNILQNDAVVTIMPSQDLEKSKEILLQRARERTNTTKFVKEIHEHFDSKCDEFYSDITIFEDDDILKQFNNVLTNIENFISNETKTSELDNEIDNLRSIEQNIPERNDMDMDMSL